MSEVKRDVCHACVSLPREIHCPVCDPEMGCRKELDAQRLRADTAEAELAKLRERHAALIEDRARFPDRPDFVGDMISAHIGNLKAGKESSDNYARNYILKLSVAEQLIARHENMLRHFASCADVRQVGTFAMDYVAALNPNPEAESHE